MKKEIILAISCLSVSLLFAQNSPTKVFKSEVGNFSFEYPSFLEKQKINNAPHMLLSLDSKKYALTIALWENNFDNLVTIWDEVIISYYSDIDKKFLDSYIEESCTKMYLTTLNNKKVRCIKSTIIHKKTFEGQTINFRQITYRLIHKGNYLQFVFLIFKTIVINCNFMMMF